ncbi:MAG: phage holin family protein [Micrococcaceae bacterium]|nr:phage holin family protein [Micrococcaceae bacterium]
MDERNPHAPEHLSTGELIARLSEQSSTLIRDEMRLAKAEFGEKAKYAGVGLGMFGAGGLLGFFGVAVAIATAVMALALIWPAWLAGLAVTVVLFIMAGVVALVGKKKVKAAGSLKPERTIGNVKKVATEIKENATHEHR